MAKTREQVETKAQALEHKSYPDTIAGKIQSIKDNKELLVYEAEYLEIGNGSETLAEVAQEFAGIVSKGTVTATVEVGKAYNLAKGYYVGGTITGVKGDDQYKLETPAAVTPTESTQVISPSEGYYGLAQVSINAIPSHYKDTSDATATAADILAGVVAINGEGAVEGTMVNNGAVSATLTTTAASYTVPAGYHNGEGAVTVSSTTKTFTPTESKQEYTDPDHKFLTSVTVEAINKASYLKSWTSDATAEAGQILSGQTAYVNGSKVSGTMTNNTAWDKTYTLTTAEGSNSVTIPAGYHNGSGIVLVDPQDKTVDSFSREARTIYADELKVLNSVVIPALDTKYQDVSAVTAKAGHVCAGYKFVDNDGTLTTGTLVDGGPKEITNFYSVLMASGASGVTVLSGTEAHYTKVEATIDGSLYSDLASI